jgi:hypothetical protein
MPIEDDQREDRISDEILVDCYNETERALGWYYYLEANLLFPFEATCILQRPTSALRIDDKVTVKSLAPSEAARVKVVVASVTQPSAEYWSPQRRC